MIATDTVCACWGPCVGCAESQGFTRADLDRIGDEIQALDFDSTFEITATGAVVDAEDYAPECFHAETPDEVETWSGWRVALRGHSGQDRYTGGVMHASEYIASPTARLLIERWGTGVTFALVTVEVLDHDEDGGCLDDPDDEESCRGGHEPAGWTILARA